MYRARVIVRVLFYREAIEFERRALFRSRPFPGLALADGPGGAFAPLFLAEVRRSAGGGWLCRAADDVAPLCGGPSAAVAEYASCGWSVARRFRLRKRAA